MFKNSHLWLVIIYQCLLLWYWLLGPNSLLQIIDNVLPITMLLTPTPQLKLKYTTLIQHWPFHLSHLDITSAKYTSCNGYNICHRWSFHLLNLGKTCIKHDKQLAIPSAIAKSSYSIGHIISVLHNTTEHNKPCDTHGVDKLIRSTLYTDLMKPCWWHGKTVSTVKLILLQRT